MRAEADDLAQETFLRAYRALSQYRVALIRLIGVIPFVGMIVIEIVLMAKSRWRKEVKVMGKSAEVILSLLGIYLIWIAGLAYGADSILPETVNGPLGLRAIALGGALVADDTVPYGVHWNPAGLGEFRGFGFQYAMMDLRRGSSPAANNSGGIQVPFLGFNWHHNESIETREKVNYYSVGFSLPADRGVNLGLGWKWLNRAKGGKSSGAWGLDAGVKINIAPELSLGVMGQNLIEPTIGEITVPLNARLGIAYYPLEDFLTLVGGVDWDGRDKFTPRGGAEVRLLERIPIRGGYGDGDLTFGTGYSIGGFSLDYAGRVNVERETKIEAKGIRHSFGLTLEFGSMEKGYIMGPLVPRAPEERKEEKPPSKKDEWIL
ncbi:MAG: hypothetical protein ACUVXI_14710 [bacterium]